MLMLACALSGCATELTQNARLAKTQKTGFSPAELAQDTDEQDAVLTQFRRRAGLNAGATIATDWDAIIAAGMQYADVKCEKYMGSLERLNRDKKTITSEIGLVGGATAGIMAAAKSAAQDVALAAIAFGLAGSTIDNLGGNVLYEVEPSSVRVLVKTLQANYRATLTTGYATRPAAMGVVLAYDALCTPMTIEAELNLAIKKAQPNVKAGDPDTGKAPSVTNADTALREKYLPGASGQSLNEYVLREWQGRHRQARQGYPDHENPEHRPGTSHPSCSWAARSTITSGTAAVQLLQLTR